MPKINWKQLLVGDPFKGIMILIVGKTLALCHAWGT